MNDAVDTSTAIEFQLLFCRKISRKFKMFADEIGISNHSNTSARDLKVITQNVGNILEQICSAIDMDE